MRNSAVLLLAAALSLDTSANTRFNYGGPFIVNALQSNEGLVEMIVPRGAPVTIVFKGCDYATSVHDDSRLISYNRHGDGKSVLISNHFKDSTQGVFPVNIKTRAGLIHTIALIPAPKNYSVSSINLKLVIENSFDCKNSRS